MTSQLLQTQEALCHTLSASIAVPRLILGGDFYVLLYSMHPWMGFAPLAMKAHPQIPFCRTTLQLPLSQLILMPSGTPSQVQNLAFDLGNFIPLITAKSLCN